MKGIISFALALTTSYAFSQVMLKPFETDFCTNYPEGTREKPELWKHCCLIHDMYFWAGGTFKERDVADLGLKNCIEDTGAVKVAKLMYLAVRSGAHSPYKYPKWKWNNGWKDGRKVRSITKEDIELIEKEISNGYDFISPEIKEKFIDSLLTRLD